MSGKSIGDERSRVAALEGYDILDTPPEEMFEDLVRLAALVCDAPIAQINFIDDTRLWTKASVGIPRLDMPRRESLCAVAIGRNEPLIVEDLTADERLVHFAREVAGFRVRFYAGVPIVTTD